MKKSHLAALDSWFSAKFWNGGYFFRFRSNFADPVGTHPWLIADGAVMRKDQVFAGYLK